MSKRVLYRAERFWVPDFVRAPIFEVISRMGAVTGARCDAKRSVRDSLRLWLLLLTQALIDVKLRGPQLHDRGDLGCNWTVKAALRYRAALFRKDREFKKTRSDVAEDRFELILFVARRNTIGPWSSDALEYIQAENTACDENVSADMLAHHRTRRTEIDQQVFWKRLYGVFLVLVFCFVLFL